jgi:aminopeptidase N
VFASNEEIANGLKEFTLKLVTPSVEKIGWTFGPDEHYLTGQLRGLLISVAGNAGHKGYVSLDFLSLDNNTKNRRTIAEAKRIFQLWASGEPNAIHANLRSAVFGLNVSEGGRDEFDKVKDGFRKTESVDGKEICLASLGRTRDAALVHEYLDLIFSDEVAVQDMHSGAASLAANPKARHLLWEYMKNNWTPVSARLASNNVVFERFVRLGLARMADEALASEIIAFFEDKDTGAYDRALLIVSDSIHTDARYKARDEASLLEWLQAHGYA